MSALRHLQRCEIGGGFIILQINAVFERLYTRSSHSRRFPEKSGLGLTNEQTGVGSRSNLSFKLEQTAAFPTIKPGHRSDAIASVSSEFGRIHVAEHHADARAAVSFWTLFRLLAHIDADH